MATTTRQEVIDRQMAVAFERVAVGAEDIADRLRELASEIEREARRMRTRGPEGTIGGAFAEQYLVQQVIHGVVSTQANLGLEALLERQNTMTALRLESAKESGA